MREAWKCFEVGRFLRTEAGGGTGQVERGRASAKTQAGKDT